jgi:DOPA 4,5-dioxygenase
VASSSSPGEITGFHAHVYYDTGSRARADRLREAVRAAFDVELGRWHDCPIGPHPRWSYQIAFSPEQFAEVVPFLALSRDGLAVLVHPLTGDDIADHSEHAIWMGEMLDLDLEALR